jgi:hypothetical protein
MRRALSLVLGRLSGKGSPPWYLAGDLATNLIAYWPLSDSALSTTYVDQGSHSLVGTAGGAGCLNDDGALYIAGSGGYVDLYSASLNTLWDGAENGFIIRAKVANVGVWTDLASHRSFKLQGFDADNSTTIRILTDGSLVWRRWGDGGTVGAGNGTSTAVNTSGHTDTGWMTLGLSCSEAADTYKAFKNGAQEGTTQTGLGVYTGPLDSAECVIGATSTAGNDGWNGWLSDFIATLNGVVPTDADHAAIHTALGAGTLTRADLNTRFGVGNWMWLKLDDADINELSTDGSHARAVNVTPGATGIGDGNTAISLDGSGDYINIWSPSLVSAFDKDNFTLSAWFYLEEAALTDGNQRTIIFAGADANNRAAIYKRGGLNDDQIQFLSTRGATAKTVNHVITSGWHHAAMVVTGGEMKAYIDGSQTGATQTAIGTWTGSLASTTTLIGAASLPLASVYTGRLAHVAIYSAGLSDASVALLANVATY